LKNISPQPAFLKIRACFSCSLFADHGRGIKIAGFLKLISSKKVLAPDLPITISESE